MPIVINAETILFKTSGIVAMDVNCCCDIPPCVPEISVVKSVSPATVAENGTVTYTITITNISECPTEEIILIEDNIPAGLAYIPGSISAGGNDSNDQLLTWSHSDQILPGDFIVLSFQATPFTTGEIINTVDVNMDGNIVSDSVAIDVV
jgi:uncharacterized repeat protein (TIGR01451 family)